MSRSERYIPPSEEELRRQEQAREDAERFDQQRRVLLRTALKKLKKTELVELTVRAAEQGKACEWLLEREVKLEKPIDLLVHDIQIAIKKATQVEERQLNYNFSVDWHAYEAILHGLTQLLQNGGLEEAKSLALKLMEQGSYQIECSDEGMMQDEIEACLRLVISAVAASASAREWAMEMIRADRVGFVCERELIALRDL